MAKKDWIGIKEIRSLIFWRDAMCDCLCTFILAFTFTSVGVNFTGAHYPNFFKAGFTMGCAVYGIIEAFGHISGAHMNPSVTLAFFILREISLLKAIIYVVVQCLGSIAGAGLVYSLTPEEFQGALPAFKLHPALEGTAGVIRGSVMELVLTAFLIWAILGSGDSLRKTVAVPSLPPALVVAADIAMAGFYTGASMNPALTLGPAVATNQFKNHIVYWLGPLLGAAIAALTYKGFTYIGDKALVDALNTDEALTLDVKPEMEPLQDKFNGHSSKVEENSNLAKPEY